MSNRNPMAMETFKKVRDDIIGIFNLESEEKKELFIELTHSAFLEKVCGNVNDGSSSSNTCRGIPSRPFLTTKFLKDQIFFSDEKTLKNNTMWIMTDEDRLKANRKAEGIQDTSEDDKIEEYMRDYTNYIVKLANEKQRKKREEERGGVKRKTRGRKRVSKKRKRSRRRSLKRKRRKSNRRNKMKGGFFWSAEKTGPNTKAELEANVKDANELLRLSDDENTNTDLTFKKVTELLPNDNKYVKVGSNLDMDGLIPNTTKGNDLKQKLKLYYQQADIAAMAEKMEDKKEEEKKKEEEEEKKE